VSESFHGYMLQHCVPYGCVERGVAGVPLIFSVTQLGLYNKVRRPGNQGFGRSMLTLQRPYVSDVFARRRRPTRVVMVGSVEVGGDNPIRVQSMTTTLTKDIAGTVAQAARLVEAGCEIVRITTPRPQTRCLGPIKKGLEARG
jgi:hypothetical protein